MKKFLFACALGLCSAHNLANHIPEPYQLIGSGVFRFAFMKIYQAELYAPDSIAALQAPLLLRLQYYRDVPAERIVKITFEQMAKQPYAIEAKLKQWRRKLSELWPDIQRNDTLSAHYLADGKINFYHNHQSLGGIADPDFSYAFLAIWLAEDTSDPALRRDLLGDI